MKSIDEMEFYTEKRRDGWYIGRCREFKDIRTKATRSALDAISEIIALTSERIRDIDESRGTASGTQWADAAGRSGRQS